MQKVFNSYYSIWKKTLQIIYQLSCFVGHPVLYAPRLYCIRPTLHPSNDTSDPPALGFLAACIAAVGPMCTRPCSLSEKVEKR